MSTKFCKVRRSTRDGSGRRESGIGWNAMRGGYQTGWRNIRRKMYDVGMDEGRKRVIAIVAGIIVARNLERADDLFGGPQGSPRTDTMIAAAVQWAEQILAKIDGLHSQ
jgi:hypothetical protein